MKLQELAATTPTKQISKVFENYFGNSLRFDSLSSDQTRTMLVKVRRILAEHRATTARHTSEKDPGYLQLIMMEQALSGRLAEMTPPPAPGQTPQGQPKPAVQGAMAKDPKLAAALKKSAAGQTLTPEEQKLVAGAAMMQAENRLRRAYNIIKESEVQQAQVVLAAQDMVDKMQGMLEDVSELQFKELPALVDSIKNQVGIDQATQFNADATAALTGLMQNLQGAKAQLDQALGVVTGTAAAAPDIAGMEAPAADDMAAMPPGEEDEELAAVGMTDVEAAPEAEPEPEVSRGLGRARR